MKFSASAYAPQVTSNVMQNNQNATAHAPRNLDAYGQRGGGEQWQAIGQLADIVLDMHKKAVDGKTMEANAEYNRLMSEGTTALMQKKEGEALNITEDYDKLQKSVLEQIKKKYGGYIGYGAGQENFNAYTMRDDATRRANMMKYQMAETDAYFETQYNNQISQCLQDALDGGASAESIQAAMNRANSLIDARYGQKYGKEKAQEQQKVVGGQIVGGAIHMQMQLGDYDNAAELLNTYKDYLPPNTYRDLKERVGVQQQARQDRADVDGIMLDCRNEFGTIDLRKAYGEIERLSTPKGSKEVNFEKSERLKKELMRRVREEKALAQAELAEGARAISQVRMNGGDPYAVLESQEWTPAVRYQLQEMIEGGGRRGRGGGGGGGGRRGGGGGGGGRRGGGGAKGSSIPAGLMPEIINALESGQMTYEEIIRQTAYSDELTDAQKDKIYEKLQEWEKGTGKYKINLEQYKKYAKKTLGMNGDNSSVEVFWPQIADASRDDIRQFEQDHGHPPNETETARIVQQNCVNVVAGKVGEKSFLGFTYGGEDLAVNAAVLHNIGIKPKTFKVSGDVVGGERLDGSYVSLSVDMFNRVINGEISLDDAIAEERQEAHKYEGIWATVNDAPEPGDEEAPASDEEGHDGGSDEETPPSSQQDLHEATMMSHVDEKTRKRIEDMPED